ncbi:MAG: efflux RND transporter permease subunit [Sandaracinus sp.]
MSSLSEPFIRRPIATSLLVIGIALASLVAYGQLPVAPLPEVDYPTIVVFTQLPGANAETMAASVTTPLESQLGQIPSLTHMSSVSGEGTSQITLQFDLDRDIDNAEQDVQAAINAASALLPAELPAPPTYSKANPADAPILSIAVSSRTLSLREVDDRADAILAQRISQVPGVGLVSIRGGQRPAVRVQADAQALAAVGLTLEDLRAAIAAANVHLPTGSLDGARLDYSLVTDDQLTDASEFRPLVIAYHDGAPVRLADVATVADGVENEEIGAWVDGRPAVVLDVLRQPGANILEVASHVKELLDRLEETVPSDLDVEIVVDRTQTIEASFEDVRFTLVLTIGLVVVVMYVFLRSVRATIIPGVAVPLSLIATFGVMYLLDYSLDNLSLMALTIATGFVVDDAIVMVENVARLIEEGKKPFEAALEGAKQIGFTIVSLTASLVAVLIPLLFMRGIVGRLFREFAVTLATSIVVSALVSLTLTAMMSATMLRPEPPPEQRSWFLRKAEEWMVALTHSYAWALDRALAFPRTTLAIAIATLALTIGLAIEAPKGFFPVQDNGLLVGFTEVGGDTSYESLVERQQAVVARIQADPDVAHVISAVGADASTPVAHHGTLSITLVPHDQRSATSAAIAARLTRSVAGLTGIDVALLPVQDLALDVVSSPAAYRHALEDTDAEELRTWTPRVVAALSERPELLHVRADTSGTGLARTVDLDRDTAARLGVSVSEVNETLYDAFGQRPVSTIFAQLTQYRVILELPPERRSDVSALDVLHVRSSSGQVIPLGALARFETHAAPLVVRHQAEMPATTISFDTAPGVSLGDALDAIDEAEAQIGLPPSIHREREGTLAEFESSLASETPLVIAALLAVFIVLGMLYESFFHPITILSTLPSAGVGAFLALRLAGMELDVLGVIGLVLLIGIVKKNAIMMIDFALEAQRDHGMSAKDAIRQACLLRFRPITMTTVAALLGALPLAFGTGIGGELRQPLGVSIVGGLLFSQLLTLLTTPVVYLAMERVRIFFGDTPSGAAREEPAE